MWEHKEVCISEIQSLLNSNIVEIDSPDGWVQVVDFQDNGEYEEYQVTVGENILRVNAIHRLETDSGWKTAADCVGKDVMFLTTSGFVSGTVIRTGEKIPVVDITVDHENHRYFSENISSHNCSGGGKSIFMTHTAASTLRQGKNVLYITMEMSEQKIAERIDANLMKVTVDSLKDMTREDFVGRVDKIARKTQGKLFIKEYPTGSAHSGHFRGLLEELKTKQNFMPDLVIIDYLGICASARVRMGGSVNTYSYLKAVAEEIRGLAVEYDIAILTGAQLNRSGFSNSDVDMSNTADSMGLVMTLDCMFALISTDELSEMDQALIKVIKNRFGDLPKFVVGLNKSKMTFFNLEETAQRGIVQTDPQVNKFVPKRKAEPDVPAFDKTRSGRAVAAEGFKF